MILRKIGRSIGLVLLAVSTACGAARSTSAPSGPTPRARKGGGEVSKAETVSTVPSPAAPSPSPSPVSVPQTASATPVESTPTLVTVIPSPTSDRPLAARVNGQPIYLADYERELERYETSLPAEGTTSSSAEGQEGLTQAQVLDMMIEKALIEQAAAEIGVSVSDAQVDAEVGKMIDWSGGEEAFQAKLGEWGYSYEEFRQETRLELIGMEMTERVVDAVPTRTQHVRARHILVGTLQEARRIRAQFDAGKGFTALAKAYSQDTSTRESGGDLGFFPRGILVAPEVEEAAFALQPGQVSEVITSSLGYHIVQVVEREPERPVSPENLRILKKQAVQKWTDGLWARAEVERFVDESP